jgi:hypothetical protein
VAQFVFRYGSEAVTGVGLLAIAAAVAARAGRDASEVIGLSGVGFTTYAFTPDDNYNYDRVFPGVTTSPAVFTLDHFGVLETLGPHLATDFRIYEPDTLRDFVLLVKSELADGRGVWIRDSPVATDVAQQDVPAERWRWVDPDGSETFTVELTAESLKGPSPFAKVMAVRPLAQHVPASRRHMLVREVVRYAARHGESHREVAHHQDVYLASGARAWVVMADWIASDAAAESPAQRFADAWLSDQAQRRQHASVFLHRWFDGLGENSPLWPAPSGTADELPLAAGHALVMSALLEEARVHLSTGDRHAAGAALQRIAQTDRDRLLPSLKRIEDPSTGLWL